MSSKFIQGPSFDSTTRFTQAPMSEVEFSKMIATPTWYTTMNGGDITPIYYCEVLPHSTISLDLEYVVRQLSASIRPVMGKLQLDIFAFFVPNRVVNESWKNVQGENTSGYWSAPEIELAPLYALKGDSDGGDIHIPVGSIGDFYGLPTQGYLQKSLLAQMNDMKARGYLSCFNHYFRDQNYQPPIPFSTLNIYNGFLEPKGTEITVSNQSSSPITAGQVSDGSFYKGAVVKALFGEGSTSTSTIQAGRRLTSFSLLDKPLKANKLHDAFTSVLPSPQKGADVVFNVSGNLPVHWSLGNSTVTFDDPAGIGLYYQFQNSLNPSGTSAVLKNLAVENGPNLLNGRVVGVPGDTVSQNPGEGVRITGSNLQGVVDLADAVGISVNDIRTAAATQQVLELLARGGSRYWSFLKTFFGVEADTPFPDIPTQIGHIRRELDMYQVAQTSPSVEGGSPQGSLSAFGYSPNGGSLFTKTFLEHGYVHVFAVIRQKNIYSSYLAPDNFRRRTMDFYLPQFANIAEQPIRLSTLNPFYGATAHELVLGYQEAWWEYRMEMDQVHGLLRSPGLATTELTLDIWHYGDPVDLSFTHVNGEWLVSNAQEVIDRSLAVTSELAPQFIGMFNWKVTKQIPMPTYSVPGMDII